MTGQHARRYSRIREWRGAKAAGLHLPRHRHNALTLAPEPFYPWAWSVIR